MTTEQKLLATAKETFITQRTQQEMQIERWAKGLSTANPEVLKELDLPEPLTLKTLIPELYSDKPDFDKYTEQYQIANEFIERANSIADKYNEEAIRCLYEYNQMSSNQV